MSLIYRVLNNGKPAVIEGSKIWINSDFPTLEEAANYLRNWLGCYAEGLTNDYIIDNMILKPYDYDGYGDTVQIVRVNV
jgi:hypothetical protein